MDVVGWIAVGVIAAVVLGGVVVGLRLHPRCPALHEDSPYVDKQGATIRPKYW